MSLLRYKRGDVLKIVAVVSGKLEPKAVKRNLFKRRVRAIIRETNNTKSTLGTYYVYANKELLKKSYSELKLVINNDLKHLP